MFGHRSLAGRSVILLSSALILLVGSALAPAAVQAGDSGRQLSIAIGVDFEGRDIRTLKKVSLDDCKTACIDEQRCKAFTYNTKAQWCFLKETAADPRPFDGAISGRIVEPGSGGAGDASEADLVSNRTFELGFLPSRELSSAAELAKRIAALEPQSGRRNTLLKQARAAMGSNKPQEAADLYAAVLRLLPNDSGLWQNLAEASLAADPKDWGTQQRLKKDATGAAVNAYLHSDGVSQRAALLDLIGRTLAKRGEWRPAIRATRASLALVESTSIRAAYDKLITEHGFRVSEHKVDSDAPSPRACIRFTDPLPRDRANLTDFVRVEGRTDLPAEAESQQICIDGLRHGERYKVLVRAGLPAADGEKLAKDVDLDIYVRDRAPSVRFLGRAYVLPKGGEAAIPVVSVNTDLIDAAVYRIGDRGLVEAIADGVFRKQLDSWTIDRIKERTGESVWSGTVEVKPDLNRDVTTAIPVGAVIADLKPGAYAITAKAHNGKDDSDTLATQWFIVSDLGLATFSGNDGLHAMVRSLTTAGPVGKVALRLIAANNEVLGKAVTDGEGHARFDPGLTRGTGGNAPALLVAEGPDGDYAFLDMTQTPFDLSDRGVEGRAPPKPLDVYLVSERGAYRPGETLHLTALVRDAKAKAVTNLPITLVVRRPDGVEYLRTLIRDQGQGGHQAEVELSRSVGRGTWHAAVYSDPKAAPLADLAFLVEDFEPERLAFDLKSESPIIDPEAPPDIDLDARFLYGAPAADLAVEGDVQIKPTDSLAAFPGYRFGLESESLEPVGGPLPAATTDEQGKASIAVTLPGLTNTSRLRQADINLRVIDESGRPVERSLSLPLASQQARIGIKPLFDGSVEEGGNARFNVIAVGTDGKQIPLKDVRWTLSRVNTSFQWYESDGSWDYEPITSTQRVADGVLNSASPDPQLIESAVKWGAYRLSLSGPDGAILPADMDFEAGWYVAPKAQDTPDLLKVSLDKERYRLGDEVKARIEPRFPGLALVMVVDDRVIQMRAVEVPEGGATVELPVTADWGPGAYVTAVLYRPMDLAAKRMPARAIGLTWAGVDPQDRLLDLKLDMPSGLQGRVSPRQKVQIPVSIGNLKRGQEAYVTVAAVDVGILNLTRYQAPAPDAWYFAQRALGMEIRDLYGQLIDRMQGVPGVVRSGGDGSLLKAEGPPPTEELVAYHSGIVKVDSEGRATVAFDIPDFNGTVRVMAMAWTADGVGHAVKDLLVRDPIVVSAALPRFLAPGDRSRLLINLTHVEGPAGEVSVSVATQGGHSRVAEDAAQQSLTLAEGGRAQLQVPLEATAVGDDQLTIDLRTPDGKDLLKTLRVPVRSNAPETSHTRVSELLPRGELKLDESALSGQLPGTGSLLLSVGAAARLDVAGLLMALDRYPYGCTEQLTSRALPLLYLDEVARSIGQAGDPKVKERIQTAIDEILTNEGSNGSFGLWSSGGDDVWLTAYVADFLTRAREKGFRVPDAAFNLALDNLRNSLSYISDADLGSGGRNLAYALYVLARNGRAAIGDLRYYADTKLEEFDTPLARAQLGAALALYGDRPRADAAFRNALGMLADTKDASEWRSDYGSRLRDGAAILALAAENNVGAVDTRALAKRLQSDWVNARYSSTQDQAWLLLAAHALTSGADQAELDVNGDLVKGALYRRLDAEALRSQPIRIANRGDSAVDALVTTRGVPLTPEPAGGEGYRIQRAYYDLEGRRVDPSKVALGDRLIAVVTVAADDTRQARLIVDDPLPAGFEIDNPHLIKAGDVADVKWLGLQEQAAHTEFRADRFVAAVDRGSSGPTQFQLAYRLRAVSPGVFAHPAATVEDMYRPQLRAWTGTGEVEVLEARP